MYDALQLIFRAIPRNLVVVDPYTPEVAKLLTITNLRLNFTKMHQMDDNESQVSVITKPRMIIKVCYVCYNKIILYNPLNIGNQILLNL